MKKNLLFTLGTVAVVGAFSFTNPTPAENFEGKITYEISYEELPEAIEPYAAMLPKESTSYHKGKKSRTEQNTMGGQTITIVDMEKKVGYIVMDMMGMKSAYKMEESDLEAGNKEGDKFDIKYTNETKTIAGYVCKKVEITSKDDKSVTYAYVTDKIEGMNNSKMNYLKGFPLEYTVKANGMEMSIKAKSISKEKVSDAFFTLPSGYDVKPISELYKLQGGK